MGATKPDAMVERAAQRLHELSEAAARRGGIAGKLAQPLAEDAVFLRKLRPSLIKARIKGDAPTDGKPEHVAGPTVVSQRKAGARQGANPAVVIGGAAGAGLALAKLIDWRGHAHPRR